MVTRDRQRQHQQSTTREISPLGGNFSYVAEASLVAARDSQSVLVVGLSREHRTREGHWAFKLRMPQTISTARVIDMATGPLHRHLLQNRRWPR
jgi:hypothetical protein